MSMKMDLTQELPKFEIKVTEEKTVMLTIEDIYEYAQVDVMSGKTLKQRIGKITDRFNAEHDVEITTDKMYFIMMKGLESIEIFVGNSTGSST